MYKTKTQKFDGMGNRKTLAYSTERKIFHTGGCHFGNYGEVEEKLLARELKAVKNDLIENDYKEVSFSEFNEAYKQDKEQERRAREMQSYIKELQERHENGEEIEQQELTEEEKKALWGCN